ncbi:MAG: hypothetical protein K8I60_20700 [Anaerolineae bacterium]|nr:hypothetical protein [Anaerolineae bacterium]
MYGMHGHHYHHHYGWHRPRPFMGLFFLFPVMLMLFFGMFLLKFLWPLLLIGAGFALFSRSRRGDWGHGGFSHRMGDWYEKSKHDWDEKPKHEQETRRYARTADGDWVEII